MKNFMYLLLSLCLFSCATPKGGPGLLPCQTFWGTFDQKCLTESEKIRVTKIDNYIKQNPKYKKYRKATVAKSVVRGMPEEMLMLSWGKPDKINKSVGSWGSHKQCIYGKIYVYIRKGVVSSWQE